MSMTILLCILALVVAPQTPAPAADRAPLDTTYTCDTDRAKALARALAADASVVEVGCQAPADGVAARNAMLAKLVDAARSRTGAVSLRKTCTTIEGDPIVHYLTVVDGEITLVTDSTADRFGPRQVCAARVARVELGWIDEARASFVAGVEGAPAGARYVVRCLPQDWTF